MLSKAARRWICAALTSICAVTAHAADPDRRAYAQGTVARSSVAKPAWRDLTPAQQAALKPMEQEWDKLDAARKRKWIEFAGKYQKMKPDEQARAQERMRGWVLLSPESRQKARDNYRQSRSVAPDLRQRAWEEYQNLTPEERQKLEEETRRRRVVGKSVHPAPTKQPPPRSAGVKP